MMGRDDSEFVAHPMAAEHDLSTDALIALAKAEISSGAEYCPALVALQERPTLRVFEAAELLTQSDEPDSRELGVRIFRELGRLSGVTRSFRERTAAILSGLLRTESDPTILGWTISAIGHNSLSEMLPEVLSFQHHREQRVRFHVAAAMIGLLEPESVDSRGLAALRELSSDDDADVRYYALTTLVDDLRVPPADLADVLRDRRDDTDEQIRDIAARHSPQ